MIAVWSLHLYLALVVIWLTVALIIGLFVGEVVRHRYKKE